MATEIDRKVVEMEIRNKSFMDGVKETIDWLGKFKDAISNAIQSDVFQRGITVVISSLALLKNKISDSFKFNNESQSLSDLQKDISRLNFDSITSGLQEASHSWSAWEAIAFTAIQNVTNRVVDAGIKIAKSLSIDQISAGWQKYDQITHSVQTIMAAQPEKTIEEVTGYIDKLNWFTDETSYNLSDMTNNISKFTNAGIDLDKATNEMMGIATAAALAGANSQSASHAMAGFSKSMAVGYMSRLNWSWIETAHLDTIAFKQALIDAAYEQGELIKEGNKFYAKDGKNWVEVSATNLRDTLSAKWLTSGAIEQTLAQYGNFADALEETYQKFNSGDLGETFTTNEILRGIDKYKKNELDLANLSKLTGISVKELDEEFKKLSSSEYDVGMKAFKAAQEAKTFIEAIDATKDAVSTGFMKSFELMFGNYEEAKVLWTDMANWLYDLFAESGNARNDILRSWHKEGGYRLFIDTLHNIMDIITDIRDVAKNAFSDFLPDITANKLITFTGNLKDSTTRLKKWISGVKGSLDLFNQDPEHALRRFTNDYLAQSERIRKKMANGEISNEVGGFELDNLKKQYEFEAVWIDRWEQFHDILKGVSSVLSVVKTSFLAIKDNVLAPIAERLSPIISDMLSLFSAIGRRITDVVDKLFENSKLSNFFKSFGDKTVPIITRIVDAIRSFIWALTDLIDPNTDGTNKVPEFLSTIGGLFTGLFTSISGIVKRVFPIVSKLISFIMDGFKFIGNTLGNFVSNLSLGNIFKAISGLFSIGIGAGLYRVIKMVKTIIENFSIKNLKIMQPTFIDKISDAIKGFADKVGSAIDKLAGSATAFKSFATSILMIAGAFLVLALIPEDTLGRISVVMGGIMAGMIAMLKIFEQYNAKSAKSILAAGSGIIAVSGSILILAAALGILALIPTNKIDGVIGLLGGGLTAMVLALSLLSILKPVKLIAAAAALSIMAPSLIAMSAALGILALIPDRALTKAVSNMAVALTTIVGALTWMNFLKPTTMIVSAAAMLILAPAIVVLAAALGIMSLIPGDKLEHVVGQLALVLLELVTFIGILSMNGPVNMIAIAASMLVLSASIVVLSTALAILSLIPFEMVSNGLKALAIMLTEVIIASALAGLVIPGLLALSASLLAISASAVLLGSGMLLAGTGIAIAALGIGAAIALVVGGISGLIEHISGVFNGIKEKIEGFWSWLPGRSREGAEETEQALNESMPDYEVSGGEIGTGWATGFNNAAFEGVNSAELMDQVTAILGEDSDKLGLTGLDLGNIFSGELSNGMVSADYGSVMDNIAQAIRNKIPALESAGYSAGYSAGAATEQGYRDATAVRSPSRVFMRLMDYVAAGITLGADRNLDNIRSAGDSMGNALVMSAEDALSPFNNYGLSPSISPVLDMSQARAGNLSFGATLTPGAARNLASVSADIRDQRDSMNDYIDQAVTSAINGMRDELTFVVPLEVDGRQFAASTARFTRSELNLMDRNSMRKGGLINA